MQIFQRRFLFHYYALKVDELWVLCQDESVEALVDLFPLRGVVLCMQGKIPDAQHVFALCNESTKKLNQIGFENLALLALWLGNQVDTLSVIENGLEAYPKSALLQARRAYVDYLTGDVETAYQNYRFALSIETQIPILLQFLDLYRWRADDAHRHDCQGWVNDALSQMAKPGDELEAAMYDTWRKRLVANAFFLAVHARDLARADALFATELARRPDDDDLPLTYAQVLFSCGCFAEATQVLQKQLKQNEKAKPVLLLLAEFAERAGRKQETLQWLRLAHKHWPDDLIIVLQLANQAASQSLPLVEKWLGRVDEILFAQSDGTQDADAIQLQANLIRAQALTEALNYTAAETLLETLLHEHPSLATAQMSLGRLYIQTGRIDEAIALFEAVKDVNLVGAHLALMHARVFPEDPLTVGRLEHLAGNMGFESNTRDAILFQLAAAYEQKKDHDKAFSLVAQANELSKAFLKYDPVAHRSRCQRIMARFSPAFKQSRAAYGHASATPVFVLGMPRSGTTLIEQILAGHSRIHGAGELGQIPQVIAGLEAWERKLGSGRSYPDCVDDLSAYEVEKIAANVLAKLREFDADADFIIDKLPHNFENVGLIKLLFPNARIISVRRDYRDIALSNYFTDYQAKHGGMGFAYDLTWIRDQLADHMLLMHHWSRVFPGEILEVRYEDVVEDTEGMARKMLDYIGVDWEPQVLNSHELDRPVKTASVWQVRQPIYKTSKAKWMRYEKHLGPLIQDGKAEIKLQPVTDMVTLPEPGMFVEGNKHYQAGELDKAEYAFKKLLHHLPEHASANFMVGLIYVHKGHINEGLALMEKALAKQPYNKPWARAIHDVCVATSGKNTRAQALAEKYKLNEPAADDAVAAGESELDSFAMFEPEGEL